MDEKERRKMEIERQLQELGADFEELREAIKDLSPEKKAIVMKWAERDYLTGSFSKPKFFRDLEEKISMANRDVITKGIGVLLYDVDDFKNVNDTCGHAAGDQVLIGVTNAVKLELRQYDSLYRYGGEEFVVISPGATRHQSEVIGERIRRAVERTNFGAYERDVTISVGVSHHKGNSLRNIESIQALIMEADAAMYRAKDQGKNRVVVYERIKVNNDSGLQSTGQKE